MLKFLFKILIHSARVHQNQLFLPHLTEVRLGPVMCFGQSLVSRSGLFHF